MPVSQKKKKTILAARWRDSSQYLTYFVLRSFGDSQTNTS